MQYKQETEKVAMMNAPYIVVPKSLSLAENFEVQRTRKILIIILGVCLGLSVAFLVTATFEPELASGARASQRVAKIGQAITAILFYAFGIFVARRYSPTGLRVFAWLNIIELVLLGICIFVILLFGMIVGFATLNVADADAQMKGTFIGITAGVFIFIILIGIASFILSVIVVKLAFKLARAIDANQRLIIQQA